MGDRELRARLEALSQPLGGVDRRLRCGRFPIGLEGLTEDLSRTLAERWGRFLEPAGPSAYRVRFLRAGREGWLPAARPGERYRLEALGGSEPPAVVSYHFALADEASGTWRVGISEPASEPSGRIVENAVRFVTARIAILEGGFAMHAAGVERGSRAWLFAGPSGSGKTTAVALAAPAETLGDDFGLVLPEGEEWLAPSLPFDNAERIRYEPRRDLLPVAGIFRLFQASETRLVAASGSLGVASLMSTVAFPWAMPQHGGALLERVERFVRSGRYQHLHFTRDARLWDHLDP